MIVFVEISNQVGVGSR